jgi:hypothetical protein
MAMVESPVWGSLVDAGQLRLLMMLGSQRSKRWPDVPVLKELGYSYEFDSPFGLAGPKGMDPAVVKKLHDAFKKAYDDPKVAELYEKYDYLAALHEYRRLCAFVPKMAENEKAALEKLGWRRRTDGCGAHQQEQREKAHASSRVLEPGGSNAGGRRLHEGRLADGQLAGAAGEAHPPLRSGWRHGPDRPALGGQALPSLSASSSSSRTAAGRAASSAPRQPPRQHPTATRFLLTPNAPLNVQPRCARRPTIR